MDRELFEAMMNSSILPPVTNEEELEIIKRSIASEYSESIKLAVTIEELSELTKEICKWLRGESYSRIGIIEEMADVHICMSYLSAIFDIDLSTMSRAIQVKLLREKWRLADKDIAVMLKEKKDNDKDRACDTAEP